MADLAAIVLRSLAYAAALQAAGVPIFFRLCGDALDRSHRPIRAIASLTALGGLVLTALHWALEPIRLTGEPASLLDGSLHSLLLASDAGTAVAVRMLGLALVLAGARQRNAGGETAGFAGAVLIVVSFAFAGHTAADESRWLLAPLLMLHLGVVAFWFGSLIPLLLATLHEGAGGGVVVERFSRAAIRLVPTILLAGAAMAWLLLPDLAGLVSPYGLSLLGKTLGFTVLMALAAANRWRFGPGISRGDGIALAGFRRTVVFEWCLIFIVIGITVTMTTLYSPGS